jgi:hypothetical protein
VIVVLASRFDTQAVWLAERWRHRGACLLTCEDLSRPGWRHESAAPARSTAVLEGRVIPVESIGGVLTRLYAVTEDELPHIVPEERAYVAAEMTAFLLAWLSSLRCTVLNRPTPSSLCGPNWSAERWLSEGARAGLQIEPLRRVLPPYVPAARGEALPIDLNPSNGGAAAASAFTFVGQRHWSTKDNEALEPSLLADVRRLADAAQVELLTASFVGRPGSRRLASAVPWVEPTHPEVADALLERLGRAS